MHEKIEKLEQVLGTSLSNLRTASRDSLNALATARQSAKKYLLSQDVLQWGRKTDDLDLGLVAFGSFAREELSLDESDFDHAIVAYKAIERPEDIRHYRLAAINIQNELRLGEPGQTRLFGGIITSADLINRIGLEDDTNRSHTQRMLFLEESVPIIDEVGHKTTVKAILKRYLIDYKNFEDDSLLQKKGVPRFLLNDAVKYWRTIAVDYQAKRWDELNIPVTMTPEGGANQVCRPKWGLRYIKLRSSRKLAFTGTLVSLFMPRILDVRVDEEFMAEQFAMPPLARLAQLIDVISEDDYATLGEIFALANEFSGNFNNREFREATASVEHPRIASDNKIFSDARAKTQRLEIALETLFQSTRPLNCDAPPIDGFEQPLSLRQITCRYMLF